MFSKIKTGLSKIKTIISEANHNASLLPVDFCTLVLNYIKNQPGFSTISQSDKKILALEYMELEEIRKEPAWDLFTDLAMAYLICRIAEYGHLETLKLKAQQLIYTDEYGDVNLEPFEREVERYVSKRFYSLMFDSNFINTFQRWGQKLLKDQSDDYFNYKCFGEYNEQDAKEILAERVVRFFRLIPSSTDTERSRLDTTSDPYDYERQIAQLLTNIGWTARATSGSGDQGVDVVATKNGRKIVIQCKLYSQPVGNKAVQEVHAAKGFENAHEAYVVTNNSYTKSAYQLASSLGVTLLHHSQVEEIFGDLDTHNKMNKATSGISKQEFSRFRQGFLQDISAAGWSIDNELSEIRDENDAFEYGENIVIEKDEFFILIDIRSPSAEFLTIEDAYSIREAYLDQDMENLRNTIKFEIVFNGYANAAASILEDVKIYLFNYDETSALIDTISKF